MSDARPVDHGGNKTAGPASLAEAAWQYYLTVPVPLTSPAQITPSLGSDQRRSGVAVEQGGH